MQKRFQSVSETLKSRLVLMSRHRSRHLYVHRLSRRLRVTGIH